MRFTASLLVLLFICCTAFCQSNGKNDWQKRNLHGKVKTIIEVLNDSKTDYQLDSFDAEGYLIKSICINEPIYVNDPNDDTAISINTDHPAYISKYTTLFYYDKEHNLLKQTGGNTIGDYVETTEYKYNSQGQLVEIVFDNSATYRSIRYEYNDKGKVAIEHQTERGKLNDYSRQQRMTYKYDAKNQLTEVVTNHQGKDHSESANVFYNMYEYFGSSMEGFFEGKAIMKYDATGRIIEQSIFDYKGKPDGKITCKYDQHNNINYLKEYLFGKLFVSLITYKYDIHNNWITKQYGKDLVYSRTITYY